MIIKSMQFFSVYSVKTSYLNQKYDEEVEVGDSPELLKHVLWDEVPKCVLEDTNERFSQEEQKIFCTNKERIFQRL